MTAQAATVHGAKPQHFHRDQVMHYHSKNLVKYPEEGGVWNWHQVRAALVGSSVQKTMLSALSH